MKRRTFPLLAIAAVLIGTVVSAGGASAADQKVPPTADAATPVVTVLPSGDVSAQVACGNTFVPPSPHGAAMYHYYKNCNGYALVVTTGYRTPGGTVNVYVNSFVTVPDGGTVSWYHASTVSDGGYLTAVGR